MGTAPEADDIVYNYDGISTVAGAIERFVAQMNENLGEVDTTFMNLLAKGWTGEDGQGRAAFLAQSAKWHQGADAMAATLRSLAPAVQNAGVEMKALDAKVAARFLSN